VPHVGVLKLLEQPHQAPRIVARLSTDIRAGDVGIRLGFTGISKRMQVSDQENGKNVGARWPEQYGGLDLVPFDSVALLHKSDAVAMNGVGDFMAQRTRELLGVLHEVLQRIHDIDVAAWRCESIGLRFVDDEELERMRITRLSHPRNRVRYRFQRVVKRGELDDLLFAFQLLVHLQPELSFLIGYGFGHGRLRAAEH
jgi:hypothetical protein